MSVYDEIYTGYVSLGGDDGKKRISPSGERGIFSTIEEALEFRNATGVGGMLKSGYVSIDTDNEENTRAVKRILDGENINTLSLTTDRGMHWYFTFDENNSPFPNKSDSHVFSVSGIEFDYKTGTGTLYDCFIVNYNRRSFSNYTPIAPLPDFLFPCRKEDKNNMSQLLGLEEGGRHDAVRDSITPIAKILTTKERVRRVVKIINRYILSKSLPDDELGGFLCDEFLDSCVCIENTNEKFLVNGKFQHDRMARYIVNTYKAKRFNGSLYLRTENGYRCCTKTNLLLEKIVNGFYPNARKQNYEEVKIATLIHAEDGVINPDYFSFRNGVLNIFTEELTPWGETDVFAPITIPHDYNPYAEDTGYLEFIDSLTLDAHGNKDNEMKKLIEQTIGYSCSLTNKLQKFFIVCGRAGTGKSILLKFIAQILGEENIRRIAIGDIGKGFKLASLSRVLANIGDDIPNDKLNDEQCSIIKKLTSGEGLNAEFKFEDDFDFAPFCKQIYSANDVPHMSDNGEGMLSRLILIPFDMLYRGTDKEDINLEKKIKNEAWIETAIAHGIKQIIPILRGEEKFINSYLHSVAEKPHLKRSIAV